MKRGIEAMKEAHAAFRYRQGKEDRERRRMFCARREKIIDRRVAHKAARSRRAKRGIVASVGTDSATLSYAKSLLLSGKGRIYREPDRSFSVAIGATRLRVPEASAADWEELVAMEVSERTRGNERNSRFGRTKKDGNWLHMHDFGRSKGHHGPFSL